MCILANYVSTRQANATNRYTVVEEEKNVSTEREEVQEAGLDRCMDNRTLTFMFWFYYYS